MHKPLQSICLHDKDKPHEIIEMARHVKSISHSAEISPNIQFNIILPNRCVGREDHWLFVYNIPTIKRLWVDLSKHFQKFSPMSFTVCTYESSHSPWKLNVFQDGRRYLVRTCSTFTLRKDERILRRIFDELSFVLIGLLLNFACNFISYFNGVFLFLFILRNCIVILK